jgi:hypothetical protein
MNNKNFYMRKREEFLKEILEKISNPIHKRLIQAYKEDSPVNSMEFELKKILIEVINRED